MLASNDPAGDSHVEKREVCLSVRLFRTPMIIAVPKSLRMHAHTAVPPAGRCWQPLAAIESQGSPVPHPFTPPPNVDPPNHASCHAGAAVLARQYIQAPGAPSSIVCLSRRIFCRVADPQPPSPSHLCLLVLFVASDHAAQTPIFCCRKGVIRLL